jgi:hypothetical protein
VSTRRFSHVLEALVLLVIRPRSHTLSLFYSFIVSLFRCFVVSLFRCPTAPYSFYGSCGFIFQSACIRQSFLASLGAVCLQLLLLCLPSGGSRVDMESCNWCASPRLALHSHIFVAVACSGGSRTFLKVSVVLFSHSSHFDTGSRGLRPLSWLSIHTLSQASHAPVNLALFHGSPIFSWVSYALVDLVSHGLSFVLRDVVRFWYALHGLSAFTRSYESKGEHLLGGEEKVFGRAVVVLAVFPVSCFI